MEILIAILVVIGVGVFLVCRELTCWYFKLTKILRALEDIDAQLKTFLEKLEVK